MKTFTIAAAILFCFNFQAFTQEIVIKGKIINPVSKTIELSFPTRMDTYEDISLKLDSIDHTFEYRRKLHDIAYAGFYHVSFRDNTCTDCHLRNIIIEPGDEVNITFDTKDFWNSLKFEGKSAEKFRYYKEDYIETSLKSNSEQLIINHANKPVNEYFTAIDQALQNKLAILQKYKGKVNPVFYTIRDADIRAIINKYRLTILYDAASQDFKPIQSLPSEYQKAFFKDLPAQNDTTIKARYFFDYITGLSYTYLSEFSNLTQNSDTHSKVSIVRQNQVYFHPAFAEELSGQTIFKNIAKRGITPKYQEEVKEFKTLYPDSRILQEIEQLIGAKKDFTVGNPAIPFKVLDLTGKEVSLEDFHGKVVYLDFWASWCAPCIVDIEQSKKVKEHFKGRDDIVFLYISIDENETYWKKAIEKYKIEGVHGIAPDDNPIKEKYSISTIPSYFIIGKDGNFHTIQPIRPSMNEGKGLINTLEKALSVNTNK